MPGSTTDSPHAQGRTAIIYVDGTGLHLLEIMAGYYTVTHGLPIILGGKGCRPRCSIWRCRVCRHLVGGVGA
ncbi:MAG: hypothetical protein ABF370_05485, partial [Verrucomicrobiales bacterium]